MLKNRRGGGGFTQCITPELDLFISSYLFVKFICSLSHDGATLGVFIYWISNKWLASQNAKLKSRWLISPIRLNQKPNQAKWNFPFIKCNPSFSFNHAHNMSVTLTGWLRNVNLKSSMLFQAFTFIRNTQKVFLREERISWQMGSFLSRLATIRRLTKVSRAKLLADIRLFWDTVGGKVGWSTT